MLNSIFTRVLNSFPNKSYLLQAGSLRFFLLVLPFFISNNSFAADGDVDAPPPVMSFSGTFAICQGQITTITAIGADTYTWMPGSLTGAVQNLAPAVSTIYTITGTDIASGATSSTTLSITVNANPSIGILVDQSISCNGAADGAISANISGGSPSYSIIWDDMSTGLSRTGLSQGTYSATVTDANGCTNTVNYILNEPNSLAISFNSITNVSCFGGNNGEVTANISGGTGPYIYLWSEGTSGVGASSTISNLNANSYTLDILDANLCAFSSTTSITEPAELLVSATGTDVSCAGGSNGSAAASSTGGISPYTYSWNSSPIQNTQIATGLSSGNYTVVSTDMNSCTAEAIVGINEPGVLGGLATFVPGTCIGSSDATATVAATGGTPPYSYSWSTSPIQTSNTATGISAGSYTATITDANNCTAAVSITVLDPAPLSFSFTTLNHVSCFGGTDGEVDVVVTNGASPYIYLWSDGIPTSPSAVNTLSAGTYTVDVLDANFCTGSTTVTITESPEIFVTTTSTNVACANGNTGAAMASATGGAGGFTFSWNSSPIQTTASAINLTAGDYTVTVTDLNNCTVEGYASINEPGILGVLASSVPVSCNGLADGSASASATGGVGPYSFSWNSTPIQNTASASGLSAALYEVTVTDANNCTVSTTTMVTQPIAVAINPTVVNVSCNGAADGTISTAPSAGATITINGIAPASTYAPGTYTIMATAANGTNTGTCFTTVTVTITEPIPVVLNASATNVSCNGAADGIISASGTGITVNGSALANPYGPGTYTVTASVPSGNGTAVCSAVTTVTITEPNVVTLFAAGTDATCNGSSDGTINTVASSGAVVTVNGNPHLNINTYPAGTYTVVASIANGNNDGVCSVSSVVVIAEPSAVAISFSNITHVACFGGNSGTLTADITGGTSPYISLWSEGTSSVTSSSTINSLSADTYTIDVLDANFCIGSATFTITEAPELVGSATSTDLTCAGSNNGTATASATGGTGSYSYSWNSSPIQNTAIATGLAAGDYTVTITDQNNCTSAAIVSITEPGILGAVPTFSNVVCNGENNGTAAIAVTGGTLPYSYSWNTVPAQTTASISSLAPGAYEVTVTDANNCVLTSTISISEPNAVTLFAIGTDATCNGSADGSINTVASPGSTVTVNGNPHLNTNTYAAGTYTVVASASNGNNNGICSASSVIVIGEPAAIAISFSAITHVACFGGNTGALTADITGGTTPYISLWSEGTSSVTASSTISALSADTYTIDVLDANFCTASASFTITEAPVLLGSATSTDLTCAGSNNGTATASETGGTGTYSYSWNSSPIQNTAIATGLAAGDYTVTITDQNSCTSEVGVSITEPGILGAVSTFSNVVCNGENNGAANVAVTGGTLPYSYTWNTLPVQTTAGISSLAPGSYEVTITDANNCVLTSTLIITEPIAVTLFAIGTDATCNGSSDGSINTVASPGSTVTVNGNPHLNTNTYAAGTYTVVASASNGNNNGICSASSVIVIGEPAAIAISFSAITHVACFGGNTGALTADITGGTTPYISLWSEGTSSVTASSAISALSADTYTIDVLDANFCTASASFTITEAPVLLGSATSTDLTCAGSNNGTATASATGGTGTYSYSWNSSPIQNTAIATGLAAGDYTVTITDQNSCTTEVGVSITEPGILGAVSTFSNVVCNGENNGAASVAVTGGTLPYSYTWNTLPVQTTAGISSLAPGSYEVTITDANNCVLTSTLIITEPIAVTLFAVGTDATCNGSSDGSINTVASPGSTVTVNGNPHLNTNTYAAGTYTVVASASNGNNNGVCSASSVIVIGEPAAIAISFSAITHVACFGGNTGALTADITGGTTPYISLWSEGTSSVTASSTISALSADTYTIDVLDANFCTASASFTITEAPVLLGSATSTDLTCAGSNNGTATASATGGTGSYSYSWNSSPIQNTAIATSLAAGDYTVTITDQNNCTTEATVSITEPGILGAITTFTNVICNAGNDGAAAVAATGGTLPYSYAWNTLPVQTTSSISSLSPGSYEVTVTDANNCMITTTVTITEPIAVTLSASATNVSCNGAADGTITATGSAGTTITINGSALANPYAPGTYTVMAAASNGNNNGTCFTTTTVTITEPIVVTLSASATNVSCNGAADGTITATGSAGTTITVNGSALANPYAPGAYTVMAAASNGNNNGTCFTTTTVTITEPIAVTLSASATNVSCNGAADGTITATGSAGTTITVNGLALSNPYAPGTYTVMAAASNGNNNGTCFTTTTVTITEPIAVTLSASATNVSCNGAADGTITATGSAGTTITVNGLALANPYAPGTYTVMAAASNGNNNGTCFTTTTVTITEPIAVTLSASATNVSCNGAADGTITATGSNGTTITVNGSALANPYAPGTYTVMAAASNGNNNGTCFTTTTVTITEPIAVTLSASATNVSCNGAADGTITATGSAGTTITVNGLALANPYAPGTYTVMAAASNGNNNGTCFTTTTVTITEPIVVTLSASATNVSCNGAADGTITASGSAGTTITVNGSALANPYAPGTYTVMAAASNGNNNGTCFTTTTVTITEPIAVTLSASATNVSCNGAADGTITATGSAGSTITVNGSALSNPYAPGTYTVMAAASNGNNNGTCFTTTTVTITEPIAVTLSASATNVSCNGAADGTITATGSAGTTITVNGSALANPYAPGTYTVMAAASNGNNNGTCFTTTTITITEPIAVTLNASAINVSCNGAADGTITATGSAGTTITVNGSALANPYAPGTYTVMAAASNGNNNGTCFTTTTVTITEPIAVTLSASATNVSCNGAADGTITATGSAGTTITVNGSALANPYAPGTYTVMAAASNGNNNGTCFTTTTVTITEPIAVTLSASATNVSCNGAADGTITATGSAGTTITVNGLALANPYAPGTYTVMAAASNGNNNGTCFTTTTVTITEPIAVTLSASATNVSCNGAADGTITASGSAGTTITVNGLALANPYAPGTYTVMAAASNGNNNGTCFTTTTVTINEPIAVTLSASATNVSCNGAADGTITATGSAGTTITVNGSALANPYAPGTYTVMAAASNGNNNGTCFTTTTVTITEPIPVVLNASATNVSCNGAADGIISASGTGITVNGSALANPYGPGTYTVTASVPSGNGTAVCSAVTTVTITEPIQVTISATASNITCFGNANAVISTVSSAGAIVTINGLAPAANYAAGTYTIVASAPNGNNNGNCSASTLLTITQPNAVTMTTVLPVNTTCSYSSDGSVTVAAIGGTSPITYAIGASTNATGLFNSFAPGTYSVTATDINGCSISSTFVIVAPAAIAFIAPVITLPTTCTPNSGAISVFANGGSGSKTYAISPNVGTTSPVSGTFNGLTNTSYTITATDTKGCIATTSYTLGQIAGVSITSASVTNATCFGQKNGTISVSGTSGTGAISYVINPSITQLSSGTFVNAGAGTYTVTATSGPCSSTTVVTITQPASFSLTLVPVSPSCNGASTGTITAIAIGATGPISYTLTPNNGFQPVAGTFVNLPSSIYVVRATDANGCSRTTALPLAQPAMLKFTSVTKTNTTCSNNSNGTVAAVTSGGVGTRVLSINPTGTAVGASGFSGLAAATYTLTVSDANSCTKTTTVQIASPAPITWYTVITQGATSGANGSIVVSANGGTGGKTYALNPIAGTQAPSGTFTGLLSGNYTATATDANGCSTTTAIILGHGSIVVDAGNIVATEGQLKIYPNPTYGSTLVNFESTYSGSATILVTDLQGKVIRRVEVSLNQGANQIELDLREMINGTYMVQLISDNGQRYSKPVSKQ